MIARLFLWLGAQYQRVWWILELFRLVCVVAIATALIWGPEEDRDRLQTVAVVMLLFGMHRPEKRPRIDKEAPE